MVFSGFLRRMEDEELQRWNSGGGDGCPDWAFYRVSWVVPARDERVGLGVELYS